MVWGAGDALVWDDVVWGGGGTLVRGDMVWEWGQDKPGFRRRERVW
jgi:hypothetical protein